MAVSNPVGHLAICAGKTPEAVGLLMTLVGGFLRGKKIDEGTNENHFLRQVYQLANGHLTEGSLADSRTLENTS